MPGSVFVGGVSLDLRSSYALYGFVLIPLVLVFVLGANSDGHNSSQPTPLPESTSSYSYSKIGTSNKQQVSNVKPSER
jgi:hypothetical protein